MTLDRTLIARCFGQHPLAAGLLLAGMAVASAQPLPKNFILHEGSKPVASIAFEDGQGRPRTLAEFRGKIVLLNVWATWCGPCRREMPSLDRLQGLLGGSDFEVVALSIDRSGIESVRKFYTDVGIRNLAIYIDSSSRATRELSTVGVPATLLIDRDGRELGRLVGPAEWDAPDLVQLLKRVIAQRAGSVMPKRRLRNSNSKPAILVSEHRARDAARYASQSARPGGTT